MLQTLQIRNYVLIDSLDVSFPEGLIIISGQTGAGKSILLGALSLILGSKADASVIGLNGDNCVVEATFKVPESDSQFIDLLDENEIELESGELTIRRVVAKSGRSRSFVNDMPITVQALQQIGSRLVDIHSQHQTLLLGDHTFQLSILDYFADNAGNLKQCAEFYSSLKSLEKSLTEVTSKLSRLSEEKDYIEARFKKLDDAKLVEGELEALEVEQKQLANSEEIKEDLASVEEIFNPSHPELEILPLSSQLKEASKALEKCGRFIPSALELSSRIEAARTELDDVLDEVSNLNSGIELSGDRLEAVESRMSFLYDLMKQFSASTISELIAKRDELSTSLFDSSNLESQKENLEKQISAEREKLSAICSALHTARQKALAPMEKSVCSILKSLELEHSVFKVNLEGAGLSSTGSDAVSFMFSASGGTPVDVVKCASGGEMSRLMLALKSLMARFVNMPTLFFDEIDSGVSGSVADSMGRLICSMGNDMQVFAITHLPQVAAKGNAHYLVEKEYESGNSTAVTSVRQLSGDDRVMEIARMLSGSSITPAAIENAKSLLA